MIDKRRYDEVLNYIIEASKRKGMIIHPRVYGLDRLEGFQKMKQDKKMDWQKQIVSLIDSFKEYQACSRHLFDLQMIFQTKFYELSKNGTEQEVRFWVGEYQKLMNTILDEQGSLIDSMYVQGMLSWNLANMRAAAEHAGMDVEVKKFTNCIAKLILDNKKRESKREQRKLHEKDYQALAMESYPRESFSMLYLVEHLTNYVLDADKVVMPDMKSGRNSDHAFASRFLVIASFVIVVLMVIGMWIFFFAKSKEMRKMSMQSLNALNVTDGLIVLLGGVILPLILYVYVNEFTVLGVREWSVTTLSYGLVLIQFTGMLITVLTLSVALLEWRLSKRLPVLIPRARMISWVFPCLSLSAMILIGMSDANGETLPLNLAGALISIAFLGWVVKSVVSSFSKNDRLANLTMCRGMLSVYAAVLVLFTALYQYYHAQEKYWVSMSEEITFKSDYMGYSTVEFRIAQQLRKEMLDRLDIIR